MIVYQITIPKKQSIKRFVKFMRDEYFPAGRKHPTRVEQVTDQVLLKRQNAFEGDNGVLGTTAQFLTLSD